jgi:hypothetical protein
MSRKVFYAYSDIPTDFQDQIAPEWPRKIPIFTPIIPQIIPIIPHYTGEGIICT